MRRSYGSCIALAMVSAEAPTSGAVREGLTVKQICAFFEHFDDEIPATQRPRWRNGVRHALSGHTCFYQPTKENHLWCVHTDQLPRAAKAAVDTYHQLKAAMPEIEHDTAIRCVLGGISPAALRLNSLMKNKNQTPAAAAGFATAASTSLQSNETSATQAAPASHLISQQPVQQSFNPLQAMLLAAHGGAQAPPANMAAWPMMMPMMSGVGTMLPSSTMVALPPAMQQQFMVASFFQQQQQQQQQALQFALMQQATTSNTPTMPLQLSSAGQLQMVLQGLQSQQLLHALSTSYSSATTSAYSTPSVMTISALAGNPSNILTPNPLHNKLHRPHPSDRSEEIAHVPSTPQSESSAHVSDAETPHGPTEASPTRA